MAVLTFNSLQSSTNYLVASLAVADFIQGLLTPFIILQHVYADQPCFVPLCLVEKTFGIVVIRANFINILLIAVDRFCYIAFPLRYPLWITDIKTFILIGFTWCYLFIETSLLVYFTNDLKLGGLCKVILVVSKPIYDRYLAPQMFFFLFMTIACYVAIGRIAYKQGRLIAAMQQPFATLEVSIFQRQKKKAKVMFMILFLFILTNIPPFALQVVIRKQITHLSVVLEQVTTLMYYTNAFINPIIYAWKSKDFKVVFKKIFKITNDINPADVSNINQQAHELS